MKNPLRFLQEVKQEAFRITVANKKRHSYRCFDGVWISINSCNFFSFVRSTS